MIPAIYAFAGGGECGKSTIVKQMKYVNYYRHCNFVCPARPSLCHPPLTLTTILTFDLFTLASTLVEGPFMNCGPISVPTLVLIDQAIFLLSTAVQTDTQRLNALPKPSAVTPVWIIIFRHYSLAPFL